MGPAALERTDLAAVASFTQTERAVLGRLLAGGLHAPLATSAGRLFDGVAALLGLCPVASFEGQAAMALEFAADPGETRPYPLPVGDGAPRVLDWRPAVAALLEDLARGASRGVVAARFHLALVDAAAAVARAVGAGRVVLTGGCFQNRILATRTPERLARAGHDVLQPRLVPPNDGGLSLGQAAVAAARLAAG
jgi:hydrogenase maturation protein HypF